MTCSTPARVSGEVDFKHLTSPVTAFQIPTSVRAPDLSRSDRAQRRYHAKICRLRWRDESCRRVSDLGVASGAVLLDHAIQGVMGDTNAVDRRRIAVTVPGVGVIAVIGNIALPSPTASSPP
jgi:hypothetical protein